MAPIFALLFGASIGLHLEESVDVGTATVTRAITALGRAIHARTGTTAAVDDFDWTTCAAGDRCVRDIRLRMNAGDVVLIRVFAGAQSIHLVLERFALHAEPRQARATLPGRDPDGWSRVLESAVAALFPEALAPAPKPLDPPAPAPIAASSFSPVPLILLGTGAVAAAVGIAFGASSQNTRHRIESEPHDQIDFDALSGRQSTHATAANVFFGAAVAAAIAGAVTLIAD